MPNYIGRTFTHHGRAVQPATVISQSEPKGKRAKVLLTVRLADGTEFKMDPKSLPAEIVFGEPVPMGALFTGGDRYRYSRNGRIFCA